MSNYNSELIHITLYLRYDFEVFSDLVGPGGWSMGQDWDGHFFIFLSFLDSVVNIAHSTASTFVHVYR